MASWAAACATDLMRVLKKRSCGESQRDSSVGCSGRRDTLEVYCPETDLWTDIDTKLVFSGRIGGAFVMKNYDL